MRIHISERSKLGLYSFLLFFLSLILSTHTHKNPESLQWYRSMVSEIVRPFSQLAFGVHGGISGFFNRYVFLMGLHDHNDLLQARIHALELNKLDTLELEQENKRLREMIALHETIVGRKITASVISYDPSAWVQTITIDRGSLDGIKIRDASVSNSGVVGQVISVSPHTARILLLIDRSSSIDVINQIDRARGVADGNGGKDLDLKFISESNEISINDKIITSGLDGIYPKGIVVGTVSSAEVTSGGLFKVVKVRPAVSFSRLEEVSIIVK